MRYSVFGQSPEPLALIMRELGHGTAAKIVAAAAVVALPTVLLAFFYGQSRIFFVMSRDGLLPRSLSKVGKRGAPVVITVFTAIVTSALAGVARLDEIAALANAGTLIAFVAVAACLLVLRKRDPHRPRVFRAPLAWLIGPVAILGCIYLFTSLPTRTQLWCLAWNTFGLLVYLLYARRSSLLAQGSDA
jgi:basic amino acid/polyamine antiporter, APA family